MIERQIVGKMAPEAKTCAPLARYDDPLSHSDGPTASQDAKGAPELPHAALPTADWTQEQEDGIYALGKGAGLAESQVTALRLIHKNYDAVIAAIESERVPA